MTYWTQRQQVVVFECTCIFQTLLFKAHFIAFKVYSVHLNSSYIP